MLRYPIWPDHYERLGKYDLRADDSPHGLNRQGCYVPKCEFVNESCALFYVQAIIIAVASPKRSSTTMRDAMGSIGPHNLARLPLNAA